MELTRGKKPREAGSKARGIGRLFFVLALLGILFFPSFENGLSESHRLASALAVSALFILASSESAGKISKILSISGAALIVFVSIGGFSPLTAPPIMGDWPFRFYEFDSARRTALGIGGEISLSKESPAFPNSILQSSLGLLGAASSGFLSPELFFRLAIFAIFASLPLAIFLLSEGEGFFGVLSAFSWLAFHPSNFFIVGNLPMYFGIAVSLIAANRILRGLFGTGEALLLATAFFAHLGVFSSAVLFLFLVLLLRRDSQGAGKVAIAVLFAMAFLALESFVPGTGQPSTENFSGFRKEFNLDKYPFLLEYVFFTSFPLFFIFAFSLDRGKIVEMAASAIMVILGISAWLILPEGHFIRLALGYFGIPFLVVALLVFLVGSFPGRPSLPARLISAGAIFVFLLANLIALSPGNGDNFRMVFGYDYEKEHASPKVKLLSGELDLKVADPFFWLSENPLQEGRKTLLLQGRDQYGGGFVSGLLPSVSGNGQEYVGSPYKASPGNSLEFAAFESRRAEIGRVFSYEEGNSLPEGTWEIVFEGASGDSKVLRAPSGGNAENPAEGTRKGMPFDLRGAAYLVLAPLMPLSLFFIRRDKND